MESDPHGYRTHLKTVVATSAAPYGYTLTIWTSGAVATHARGIPTAWDALLLLVGAVLGFAIVAALAYGHPSELLASREHGSVRLWGGFHLVSVGLAIGAAALVTTVVKDPVVWMIVGLAATVVYLVVIALQFTLATLTPMNLRSPARLNSCFGREAVILSKALRYVIARSSSQVEPSSEICD